MDWAADRRGDPRLRQPGGRGQPQRGAHGGAARRPARTVPGVTVNRLCASGLEAVGQAARAIRRARPSWCWPAASRACPARPRAGQGRRALRARPELEDTTLGWRFVNPTMEARFGIDAMAETAENLAGRTGSRADQDAYALRSQRRAARPGRTGCFAAELVPVAVPAGKGDPRRGAGRAAAARRDARRARAAEAVPRARHDDHRGQRVGLNDGAAALLLASSRRPCARPGRSHGSRGWPAPACPSRDGPRPGARDPEAPGAPGARRSPTTTSSRSTRRSRRRCSRAPGRCASPTTPRGEPERRGHRARTSARRERRAALMTAAPSSAARRRGGLVSLCVGVGQGLALGLECVGREPAWARAPVLPQARLLDVRRRSWSAT